jgi:hypothetical protein
MHTHLEQVEEVLWAKVRKRYREYITSASRRGVSIRTASSSRDAEAFRVLLANTGRHKRFPVRRPIHFERLWTEYIQRKAGTLLLAEVGGRPLAGMVGVRFGRKAYMLYATTSGTSGLETNSLGPVLYWEFIRWAKREGCTSIDWGGIATHYPPQPNDPGFGLYRFKQGFVASVQYLSPYLDLVFSPPMHTAFRITERTILGSAWTARATFNGRSSQLRTLGHGFASRLRQLRANFEQLGLEQTLYWTRFTLLRPNRIMILARRLADMSPLPPLDGVSIQLVGADSITPWRDSRTGLSSEFFLDRIDGVNSCIVARIGTDIAGIIWIYRHEDISRFFHLGEHDVELNGGYVLPEHRHRGLFKHIVVFGCWSLSQHGYRTVYAGVHSDNAPSLGAFHGAGFRNVGCLRRFLVFRRKFRTTVRRSAPMSVSVSTGE